MEHRQVWPIAIEGVDLVPMGPFIGDVLSRFVGGQRQWSEEFVLLNVVGEAILFGKGEKTKVRVSTRVQL